jgi:DNA-binding transcriptional regulator YiaG
MDKIYKSEPLMVIHEMAQDLYEIGAITDAEKQEYDADCLLPDPAAIKIHKRFGDKVF